MSDDKIMSEGYQKRVDFGPADAAKAAFGPVGLMGAALNPYAAIGKIASPTPTPTSSPKASQRMQSAKRLRRSPASGCSAGSALSASVR